MKKILSLLLAVSMVCSTFAPMAYAEETAEVQQPAAVNELMVESPDPSEQAGSNEEEESAVPGEEPAADLPEATPEPTPEATPEPIPEATPEPVLTSALAAQAEETEQGILVDATYFPDEVFRNYVSMEIDTNADGQLSEEERNAVTGINLNTDQYGYGIRSLEGIEFFPNLVELSCPGNWQDNYHGLEELDLSGNTKIESLYLSDNQVLHELDVSGLTKLKSLNVHGTALDSLDLSRNIELEQLWIGQTNITEIDLGNNSALQSLACTYLEMTELDISGLTNLWSIDCYGTPIHRLDVSQNTNVGLGVNGATQLMAIDLSPDTQYLYLNRIGEQNVFLVSEEDGTLHFDDYLTKDEFENITILDSELKYDSNSGIVKGLQRDGAFQYQYNTGNTSLPYITVNVEYCQRRPTVEIDSAFPDEAFRNYVSENFDTDHDGFLTTEEQLAVSVISISEFSVTSLEGIENFPMLQELRYTPYYQDGYTYLSELNLQGNTKLETLEISGQGSLKSLDVSMLPSLRSLDLSSNGLTSIDLSGNKELEYLYLRNQNIGEIDVSNNTKLRSLAIQGTQISQINVSMLQELNYFSCSDTKITALDLSENHHISNLDLGAYVRALDLPENASVWVNKWEQTVCSVPSQKGGTLNLQTLLTPEQCKKVRLQDDTLRYDAETGVVSGLAEEGTFVYEYATGNTSYPTLTVNVDYVEEREAVSIEERFPDHDFRSYVETNLDTDKDGMLSNEEQAAVTSITLSGNNVRDLTGVEVFYNLRSLESLPSGQTAELGLTKADLTQNKRLQYLNLGSNIHLKSLDIHGLTRLQNLYLWNVGLHTLDLTGVTALNSLNINNSKIRKLNISDCEQLTYLMCDNTALEQLDLSNLHKLGSVSCQDTMVHQLNLTQCLNLWSLQLGSHILALDLPEQAGIYTFIKQEGAAFLETSENGTIELGKYLSEEQCKKITLLSDDASYNPDTGIISGLAETGTFQYLYHTGNINHPDITVTVEYASPRDPVAINEEVFPDEIFRQYVLDNIDADQDQVLSSEEQYAVQIINLNSQNVRSLRGIEYFPNLEQLECNPWQIGTEIGLNELDLSANKKILYLNIGCQKNLKQIDVSVLPSLTYLNVENTGISNLDVSQNLELRTLSFGGTNIRRIDLSHNTKLGALFCCGSKMTEIDLSNQTELMNFDCSGSNIEKLDLTNNHNLRWLYVGRKTKALDLSDDASIMGYSTQTSSVFAPVSADGTIHLTEDFGLTAEQCRNITLPADSTVKYDPQTGIVSDLSESGSGTFQYTYDVGNSSYPALQVNVQYGKALEAVEINKTNFPDDVFRKLVSALDTNDNGTLEDAELRIVENMQVIGTNRASITVWNSEGTNVSADYENQIPIKTLKGIEKFTQLRQLTISCYELAQLDLGELPNLTVARINAYQTVHADYIQREDGKWQIDLNQLMEKDQLVNVRVNPYTGFQFDASTGIVTMDSPDLFSYWYDTGFQYPNGSGSFTMNVLVYSNDEDGEGAIPIDVEHFPDYTFRRFLAQTIDVNGSGALSKTEIQRTRRLYMANKGINDLTGLAYFPNLEVLDVNRNNLTTLDVSGNPALKTLSCYNNQISTLKMDGCTQLQQLLCFNNELEELDVTPFKELTQLYCYNNHLTQLDLSQNEKLGYYVSICPQHSNQTLVGTATADGYQIDLKGIVQDASRISVDVTGCPMSYYANDGILMLTETPDRISYTFDTGMKQYDKEQSQTGNKVLLGVAVDMIYQGTYTPPKTEEEKKEINKQIENGSWGEQKEADNRTQEEQKQYEDDKKTVEKKIDDKKVDVKLPTSEPSAESKVTVEVKTDSVDVAAKVLTSDENLKKNLENDNVTVTTEVKVEEAAEEKKTEQESNLRNEGILGNNGSVNATLDINVTATVQNNNDNTVDKIPVTETNGGLIFTANVPKEQVTQGTADEEVVYGVVRIHEGKAERLDQDDVFVTNNNDGSVSVSFRADRFSIYNIVSEKIVNTIYSGIKSAYYTIENGILKGFSEGDTVSQLLSQITPTTVEIRNAGGEIVSGDAALGTGYTVTIPGKENSTVQLLLNGDVNGDSIISVMDAYLIRRHIAGLEIMPALTDLQLLAGDVNGDGAHSVYDAYLLRRRIAGLPVE